MNRREAIIAGMAGITAAVGVAPTADAQASEGDNPDLDQIRTLLRAHDVGKALSALLRGSS